MNDPTSDGAASDTEFVNISPHCATRQIPTPEPIPRTKSTYDWTTAEVEQLIEAVRVHECLWNTNSPGFNCRHTKLATWREVSAVLNDYVPVPADQVRRKWDLLKMQYYRLHSQMRQKLGRRITWHYFNALEFLRPVCDAKFEQDMLVDEISAEAASQVKPVIILLISRQL